MIDLHLHTTASDGRLSPGELVEQAALARLRVMAVTDHDTTAAVPGRAGARARARHRSGQRHRNHGHRRRPRRARARVLRRPASRGALRVSRASARGPHRSRRGHRPNASPRSAYPSISDRCWPRRAGRRGAIDRAAAGRARDGRRRPRGRHARGVRPLARTGPSRRSCRAPGARFGAGDRHHP